MWFDDEYKEYFYTREPMARYVDAGNLTAQHQLRKDLECKSFDWFMKTVAPDLLEKFPPLPPNVELGSVVSVAGRRCLDTLGRVAPAMMGLAQCGAGGGQLMRLNAKGEIQ